VVWPRSGKSVEAEVASDTRWSGEKAARRLGPALLIVDRKHQSQSDPSIPIFRFLRTGPFAFPSSQRSRDSHNDDYGTSAVLSPQDTVLAGG
jgi:hypothetical protein